MKIKDFLNEGEVVAFPTQLAKHRALDDRLARASSRYSNDKVRIFSWLIFSPDNEVYEKFETYAEAKKVLPKLMMKTGRRDLEIREV